MITRRKFVAGASAGVAGALLAPSLVRAQQAPLVLWGPPATPSLILAQAAQAVSYTHLTLPTTERV